MHKLKLIFERTTHTRVMRELPRGIDLAYDLKNSLPGFRCRLIFDVGANVGQSASVFSSSFPEAEVFSFEPVQSTFEQLRRNVSELPKVKPFCTAFGAEVKQGQMFVEGASDRCRLVAASDNDGDQMNGRMTEIVRVTTLDAFCDEHRVDHIDLLKIDTEGGDLDVLKGARRRLDGQAIDIIEVEAGMNRHNDTHVPFEELRSYLDARSYYLFGFYEQVHEWPTGRPNLRRTNPVFLSRQLIERNIRIT